MIRIDAPTVGAAPGSENAVVVRLIPRSGSSQAALSFGLAGNFDAYDEGEGGMLGEEETVAWSSVSDPQWRILKI